MVFFLYVALEVCGDCYGTGKTDIDICLETVIRAANVT